MTQTTRTITARWVTGVDISSVSCSFGQHLLSAWRPASTDLRADLKAATAVKRGTERRAALKKIADSAVAGNYGATVESFAKAVKASPAWKSCTPSGS
jgi:hypothetical protein